MEKAMFFQWNKYGAELGPLLPYLGDGKRALPLVRKTDSAPFRLPVKHTAREYFPSALAPVGAMAGACLYAGDWAQAHFLSQDDDTHEGSYWHGIVHRMEPDPTNANYWFHRVGEHAIWYALGREAKQTGELHGVPELAKSDVWVPARFVDLCQTAVQKPGSKIERAAMEVQLIEWQLLFDHCAKAGSRGVQA